MTTCWCGGNVVAFIPDDTTTMTCVNNNDHDWKADIVTAAKTTLKDVTDGPWVLSRESCDCSEGMCSHGTWPYAIHGPVNDVIANNADRYTVAHTAQYGHEITEISELTDADAQFIADARALLPALVAEVERNRDLIAEFRRRDESATRVIERLRSKPAPSTSS